MDYSTEVRRRFADPARAGEIAPAAGGAGARDPAADSVFEGMAEDRSLNVWIRFQVQSDGVTIRRVRFSAFGCPHTIAAADLVAEELEGAAIAMLGSVDFDAVAQRLDLPREKHGKLLRIEDALSACHSQAMGQGRV